MNDEILINSLDKATLDRFFPDHPFSLRLSMLHNNPLLSGPIPESIGSLTALTHLYDRHSTSEIVS